MKFLVLVLAGFLSLQAMATTSSASSANSAPQVAAGPSVSATSSGSSVYCKNYSNEYVLDAFVFSFGATLCEFDLRKLDVCFKGNPVDVVSQINTGDIPWDEVWIEKNATYDATTQLISYSVYNGPRDERVTGLMSRCK